MNSIIAHASNYPHIHPHLAPYVTGLVALGLLALIASHWARKNRP